MSLPIPPAAKDPQTQHRATNAVTALAAIAMGVLSAGACPVQFTQHGLGSWFEHCRDNQPVFSYMFLLGDPAGVNTAALNAVCRDAPSLTSQQIPCQPEAGVAGDDRVTLQFDWGGIGAINGCPNPTGSVNGSARIHTHTVTQDGTSILTSLSFQVDLQAYFVEMAHPWIGTTEAVPLACDEPDRRLLRVDGTSSSGGTQNVDLTLFAPRISIDCDPGTGGELIDLCTGASPIATITTGRVYLQRGACPSLPVADLRTSAWTFLADSDAQGHASVSFPAPASGECVSLGATYRFNGQESPAIAGFLRSPFASCEDADGDGVTTSEGDCDDGDSRAYPGKTEVCDGIDNDCDAATDEGLGSLTCGRGRCALVIPACSGGVPQTCPRGRPVTPPCGPPVRVEPVPVPVVPVE